MCTCEIMPAFICNDKTFLLGYSSPVLIKELIFPCWGAMALGNDSPWSPYLLQIKTSLCVTIILGVVSDYKLTKKLTPFGLATKAVRVSVFPLLTNFYQSVALFPISKKWTFWHSYMLETWKSGLTQICFLWGSNWLHGPLEWSWCFIIQSQGSPLRDEKSPKWTNTTTG